MPDLEYPSKEHLTFWWTCLRKQSYENEAEASAVNAQYPDADIASYPCHYGGHWHNGKRAGPNSKHGPSMLRKQWRKMINKPTPEALAAAYERTKGRED